MKIIITESQYKKIIKENSLFHTLIDSIRQDGLDDTADLVGGFETLRDIMNNNKEGIISYLLSFLKDLRVVKHNGSTLLMYDDIILLEKRDNYDILMVYDNNLRHKIDSNLYSFYYHFVKDMIWGLIDLYPEFKTKTVDVYKDISRNTKLSTFTYFNL